MLEFIPFKTSPQNPVGLTPNKVQITSGNWKRDDAKMIPRDLVGASECVMLKAEDSH